MDETRDLLLLTPDFPPNRGGVARYLDALATYYQSRIDVIAELNPNWQSFDPTAPYPVYRMELLAKRGWMKWRKSTKYLKSVKGKYKTVFISHVLPYGSAAMMAKVPYVLFVHGLDIRLAKQYPRKRRLAKKVLKRAKLVVANSEALAQELLNDFGVQSLVIHPCLQVNDLATKQPSETFRLLTVSRLVERKGHSTVLNTLAYLRRTNVLHDFVYNIVGTGPMKQTLQSMVHELGLDGHVQFHDEVPDADLGTLYAEADVFVMPVTNDPIDKEGFGYVFLEAAAHGTPSITSRIPGVDEAVLHGETGILIDAGDEGQLAGAITQLVNDPAYKQQLGEAAYVRTKAQFGCDVQFAKLDPYL